jgi:hypothetical protein
MAALRAVDESTGTSSSYLTLERSQWVCERRTWLLTWKR